MNIYILTNPELGWDCIVGAGISKVSCLKNFSDGEISFETEKEAEEFCQKERLVIHERTIEL